MLKAESPISKKIVFTVLIACLMGVAIYRPLPPGMTIHLADRVVMHIIEPFLRIVYYYPADKLCSDLECRLSWTRNVLNCIAQMFDPIVMVNMDMTLDLSTEYFNGVMVRMYLPRGNRSSDGAVFFVHGGGFVLGNTAIYEGLMRRMTKMMNMAVVSVEYRLAPEAIYPGGLEDCEAALEYFMNSAEKYGIDPYKIVAMGDSAGGNLVASLTQRRHVRKAKPPLAGQVLLYPLLQFSDLQSESFRYYHKEMKGMAVIDPMSLAYYYMWYAGIDVASNPDLALAALTNGHVSKAAREKIDEIIDYSMLPEKFRSNKTVLPPRAKVQQHHEAMSVMEERLLDPSFAPLMRKDLSGLPKAMVVTCEYDILRDEGILYAHRLKAATVDTEWKHFEHGFHAMLNFHNELIIARESLQDIVDWTMNTVNHI